MRHLKDKIQQTCSELTGPFFFYDLEGLAAHLRTCKSSGVDFWYASKANPLGAILETVIDAGFGIDVASPGELRQAISHGADPDKILVTGPAKSSAFFEEALRLGVKIFVLESFRQVELLHEKLLELKLEAKALLRLQLRWEESEASMLGGNAITPFGLEPISWLQLQLKNYPKIQFIGVHAFQWGNILDPERLQSIWSQVALAATKLIKASEGIKLKVLDFGGGIGIPYTRQGQEIKWSTVAQALKPIQQQLSSETRIWLELGRFAVGPYGAYVCEVIDRKTVSGKELLILEGGVHHIVRPALLKESFPVELLRESAAEKSNFQVHGPLCTALDTFGELNLPADTKPGDYLIFWQCGAYGFTESMPYFLCHDLPAEVVWDGNATNIVRQVEPASLWLL